MKYDSRMAHALSISHPTSSRQAEAGPSVAVVIPSHRVTRFILDVIDRIGPEVARIYVVDDCCPDGSGALVQKRCRDARVSVLYHTHNQGVGGATLTGYRHAIADGNDLIVKLDGDGQMDPGLIPRLLRPITSGTADYTKGNRFFHPKDVRTMPWMRLVGNAALSLISKISSGYWQIMDPTNGFTCIEARVAKELLYHRLSARYFFESDVLFRLNTLRAVVLDVPMTAHYGDEQSGLHITRIIPEFLRKHGVNFGKRLFYNYILRNFSIATLEFLVGVLLLMGGGLFGMRQWSLSIQTGVTASGGTVMLAALPVLVGVQLVLAAINYDISSAPVQPLHQRL